MWGSFGGAHEGPYPFTVELGGQIIRDTAPNAYLRPTFDSAFAGPLDIFEGAQNADLDWGDGRDVKLTYRPGMGPWTVSAGARFGRNNGSAQSYADQTVGGNCVLSTPADCAYYLNIDPKYEPYLYPKQNNHADASVYDSEEHTLVDFGVGLDVGIGGLSQSSLGAALRYAQFESATVANLRGVPNWVIPAGAYAPGYDVTHTTYNGQIEARRSFKGVGPMISWQAAFPLHDWDSRGRLDIDWSIEGGVLFGDRKAAISGREIQQDYLTTVTQLSGFSTTPLPHNTVQTTINVAERTEEATVPSLGASLGLSYTVDRMEIGAGYRWERHYDVTDGGFGEQKAYDRTTDGPYFKIAVGFGG